MKISLKEFWNSKERLAIHCDTEEKAIRLLNKFDEMGKRWYSNNFYTAYTNWGIHRKETCYNNKNAYCYEKYYKEKGYTIYEFEDVTDFMEEKPKVENNLEHFINEIVKVLENNCDEFLINYSCHDGCSNCPLKTVESTKKWLLAPYEPKIELLQWEYEVVSYYLNADIRYNFNSIKLLMTLKDKGYFKGIIDTSMSFKEILEKSVIVDGTMFNK